MTRFSILVASASGKLHRSKASWLRLQTRPRERLDNVSGSDDSDDFVSVFEREALYVLRCHYLRRIHAFNLHLGGCQRHGLPLAPILRRPLACSSSQTWPWLPRRELRRIDCGKHRDMTSISNELSRSLPPARTFERRSLSVETPHGPSLSMTTTLPMLLSAIILIAFLTFE